MAEQVSKEEGNKDSEECKEVKKEDLEATHLHGENKQESIPDCPVCLQAYTLPVKLKCGHIFCFLCIKGVAFRSRRCALCRQDVDLKYFDHPEIVHFEAKTSGDEGHEESSEDTDRYQWYYEGRNGWWQYEESSSAELEKAHKDGKRSCELLIAGFLYFVDFDNMIQFRKTEPGRRRRIKRDVMDAEKKGVAGLRLGNQRSDTAQSVANDTTNNRPTSAEANPTVDLRNIQRLVIGSANGGDGGDSDGQTPQHANRNN
ncbi:E3 ubiquitin- ligase RNF146 [Paramuricea clavata]|uniref:E3 ubiquitin-protein ligase n=1 Tax=Paramuricea clavata TaxID=317549 RepID=A0A6S7HG14_PARCT|nr:E3 ubiquitin- ligase RNF146 [Paramuricea clavata]